MEDNRENSFIIISVVDNQGLVKRRVIQKSDLKVIICNAANSQLSGFDLDSCESNFIDHFDLLGLNENEGCTTIVDKINRGINLYVFGAGHVGKAVVMLGKLVGYNVIAIDDREQFLKDIDKIASDIRLVDYSSLSINIKNDAIVVIVTRGHQFDENCLRYVLGFNVKYVGMIGSKRRVLSIFNKLERSGISRTKLESVHAPIGIDICAKSPIEIGISIIAQVINVLNK